MAISEPRAAQTERPAEPEEPAYEGKPGQTRLKPIHFPGADRSMRSVQVYWAVNVASDPHLRELALTGALHRFENGEQLAVPFVFHDPGRRKLALVVPESLRHRELALRAELMRDLADATEVPVPSYAREATTVVGFDALRAYLERPDDSLAPVTAELEKRDALVSQKDAQLGQRESQLAQREAAVLQREAALMHREGGLVQREGASAQRETTFAQRESAIEQQSTVLGQRESSIAQRESAIAQLGQDLETRNEALTQREARLHARAEHVTSREDELRTSGEEQEAAQADLAMREQELEARLEMLRQREADLAQRFDAARSSSQALATDVEDAEDVEEIEELEPLATSPGRAQEDLSAAVEMVDEGRRAAPQAPDPEEVEEIVDDVEDLVEVAGDVTGVHADVAAEHSDLHPVSTTVAALGTEGDRPRTEPPPAPKIEAGPRPSVPPPAEFGDRKRELTTSLEAGTVRLFARLPEGREDALAEPPDLLAQLVVVEECPIVLLTIVEEASGRPLVLRTALDPKASDDKRVLDALRREYRARLALFTSGARYLRTMEISAPREVNVARILDRVGKMRSASAIDVPTATERVLSAPPPVGAKESPFHAADAEPKNAREALDRLGRVAEWSTHEKLDHALLVLSIPRDVVDATVRTVVESAVSFGLALPGQLPERAIALGAATDAVALVRLQIDAFAKTSALTDRGGLGDEAVAENWERLLKLAADNEVAIDTDTHEIAWNAIRKIRGGGEEIARDLDSSKLKSMGLPELALLLEHPRHRKEAALELCRRNDPKLAETLCRAVRKMPRAEVVRVAPRLTVLGDDAGDALVDGLSARKTFVRQAFALVLGKLELRRAVVPLLHLLQSEESEVWREIARVLGSFGNASFRTISRQLKDPKGRQDRLILTLAHLCNHGCAKQIDKMTREEKGAVATMAIEALTLREQAKAVEAQVLGAATLLGEDPILKFSRRFYEELDGRAPEQDLEDAGVES